MRVGPHPSTHQLMQPTPQERVAPLDKAIVFLGAAAVTDSGAPPTKGRLHRQDCRGCHNASDAVWPSLMAPSAASQPGCCRVRVSRTGCCDSLLSISRDGHCSSLMATLPLHAGPPHQCRHCRRHREHLIPRPIAFRTANVAFRTDDVARASLLPSGQVLQPTAAAPGAPCTLSSGPLVEPTATAAALPPTPMSVIRPLA